jgi:hypothetical protein
MVKKLFVVAAVLLTVVVPLRADVRYTLHMEVRQASSGGGDQLSMMMGAMLTQMFPPGGVDQLVVSGPLGVRTEQKQAFAGMPAGLITIVKADGQTFMLDPAAKTYSKQPIVPAEASAAMAGMKPDIKVTKTGKFETIEGMKAERVDMAMSMPMPGMDAATLAQMPPGFPTKIDLKMEMWVTDAIKQPAGAASMTESLMKQFGLTDVKDLNDGRTMIKGVMSMMGIEMVFTTKGFSNEAAPASLFEIPKDYKEVAAIK